MTSSIIYPWMQTQWAMLNKARTTERLSHALLFTGVEGIGKVGFTEAFVCSLLCAQQGQHAKKEKCHHCDLVENKTHPNLLWLTSEKEGQAIKVDQIRDVKEFVNQSSWQGEYRIVVIHPADKMNINAANALLKILEEPPAGAILILVNDQNGYLPATILSRCQHINFSLPEKSLALTWLNERLKENKDAELLLSIAQGAPLRAFKLSKSDFLEYRQTLFNELSQTFDPLKLANNLKDIEPLLFLDLLLAWVSDLLKVQIGHEKIINHDYLSKLNSSLTQLKNSDLFKYQDFIQYLSKLRKEICIGINFNKQLLIESVLIKWINSHVPS